MTSWILVFAGGGAGSICRYFLTQKFNYTGQEYVIFPYGTMLANVLSCFILGMLVQKQFSSELSENYRLLLATGFCGGFSTFSTFAYEMYIYIQKDQLIAGLGYTVISIIAGLVALVIGIKIYQIFI